MKYTKVFDAIEGAFEKMQDKIVEKQRLSRLNALMERGVPMKDIVRIMDIREEEIEALLKKEEK